MVVSYMFVVTGICIYSNHFFCDYLKGSSTDTNITPKIISLSSNIEIITAISNDLSYENIFLSVRKNC